MQPSFYSEFRLPRYTRECAHVYPRCTPAPAYPSLYRLISLSPRIRNGFSPLFAVSLRPAAFPPPVCLFRRFLLSRVYRYDSAPLSPKTPGCGPAMQRKSTYTCCSQLHTGHTCICQTDSSAKHPSDKKTVARVRKLRRRLWPQPFL